MELAGLSIVITGGGTGIGAATAKACATAGMSVLIAGRRSEPLEQVAAAIEDSGGICSTLALDVTDAAQSAFGSVYAVFANAGYGLDRLGHRTSMDELRSIFEVNFFATQRLLAEAAGRWLASKQHGHLLACSSCVAKFAMPYFGAYAATKGAQDLFCQAMRVELAPAGIHVSTVHPITTTTEFFDVSAQVSDRTDHPTGLHHTPRAFRQSPDRVARAVVRCLRRPRPEVWTSRMARIMAALRGVCPRLMDRQFRSMLDSSRL
jgi:short-subunit dehydrogenase